MADPDVEWEHRRLCPDGACLGVVGSDGRCKVCGTMAPETGGPFRGSPDESPDDADDSAVGLGEVPVAVVDAAADSSADFDDERELCSDDACIGLIGPNGRCNECGKPRG